MVSRSSAGSTDLSAPAPVPDDPIEVQAFDFREDFGFEDRTADPDDGVFAVANRSAPASEEDAEEESEN